ncbi:MAG: exopolysaccharide biosynthesis polyprenyl glycosylphosphotransferase [Candidatus Saccharibacteria bacterium]|nr:exopolysaccharide biosynthesis polyprenyl glycosylphosphotransferase [Candidatus Saccharibacteria bacterium]
MKTDRSLLLRVALVAADVLAVVISFALAYYYRTHISDSPYYFTPEIRSFVILAITLVPLWLGVNFLSGLYERSVYLYRPKEYGRILIASVVSVMAMISYGFFTEETIFPVRIIAVYFVAINFIIMVVGRELVRGLHRLLLQFGYGRRKVLIIGQSTRSAELAQFFVDTIGYGYDVVGVVAKSQYLPSKTSYRIFSNTKEAIAATSPDILIQTDLAQSEAVHDYAIEHHVAYMFVPQQDRLLSRLNSVEIVGGLPIVEVRITKLFGAGRFWKRLMDVVLGGLGLLIALPIMLVIALIMKLTRPKDSVLFSQVRLTRLNREFRIYKFRSQKSEYDGTTPEEAFTMMGRPELIKEYRSGGDRLDDDPRVTRLGAFLRATSLDELPQLFNVVRGDISLVGPRALIPQEINQYKRKSTILSVKAGLTGLAQVMGRRSISFEERRRLDVYYVQNWSLLLDIQILFKTVMSVLFRRGAS